MKKRILTLALVLILIFSAVAMPVSAATAQEVFNYLKDLAMQGTYSSTNNWYFVSFSVGNEIYYGIFYLTNDNYIEASIFNDELEITWRIPNNPKPAYTAYIMVYDDQYTTGTVSIAANYNGAAYTSFRSFSGDTEIRSDMLSVISQILPAVVEYTRAVINENDYTLSDLGLTAYNKCSFVHAYDHGQVTQQPTCTTTGTMTYTCRVCGSTWNEEIPTTDHVWTFTRIVSTGSDLHASTGLYTCTICGATEVDELCASKIFTDMPAVGKWAHAPIDWAYFNGITAGKSPTTFAPNDTVTRAEALTFLWKTVGSPEPATTVNPFTDVPAGKYYYKPVLWAVENEITKGTSENTFGPKEQCSRAQILTFIWIAAGKPEPVNAENPFTDVKDNKYYYKAVLWGVENNITKGVEEGLFGPNQTCTRAQIVAFLYKAKDLMN